MPFPARLKEKAASSYEITGLLPDTVRVISAFKADVYHSKRPTYACAKNEAILCFFMSF